MGVINKQTRKIIIVVILLLIEVMIMTLIYKTLDNKNNKLDEVNMLGKNSGLFAIYIKEPRATEYTPSLDNEFPSSYYELDTVKSGCIDSAGNSLDVEMNYEDGEVEVKTNQSVYCYLYFYYYLIASNLDYSNIDYTTCTESQCAIDELYSIYDDAESRLVLGLSNTLEAGLYRYQGLIANNYICFGTTDKNTCTSNPDKYMYRIIGINSSGQRKLIKKEALEIAYDWNTDKTTDTKWPNSDLYDGLNGSYFLTNTTYVPDSSWSNRIATTSWKYGDLKTSNASVADIASAELGFSDTVNAKIGLLYLHDYLYGFPEGKNCSQRGYCKTSWLYLNQKGNDGNAPNGDYEWTMTRYDFTLYYNQAWKLNTDSLKIESASVNELYSVRPVFYLTANQERVSGDGTLNDPFILS